MFQPSLTEFKRLAERGNLVPVYREIVADMETPVSAFLKIARGGYSFLLESVEGGERLARYSFIGTEPYKVVRAAPDGGRDPLSLVQEELDRYTYVELPGLPRFVGGAVGYLSYETVRYFEELPAAQADPLGLPEAVIMFTNTLLVFDHLRHKIKVLTHAHVENGDAEAAYERAQERIDQLVSRLRQPVCGMLPNGSLSPQPWQNVDAGATGMAEANMTPEQFCSIVERAKEYILAGDIIQVVLSQRLARSLTAHPFTVYRALRTINPSPYMYYLHLDDCHVVGTSPELLVQVDNGIVSTHPIAGTRPRGKSVDEDQALELELRADEKERAEHIMLLDLGRNDIGRVSEPGTVRVTQQMEVERYSHVMHLISHVEGRLKAGLTQYDALRACFPAGTVSGAPKIRAMEIIAELEPDRRGPYAGAVGYFSYSGNLDTAITIRTMVVKDGVAYVQSGGGIVADSVPEKEYGEAMNKARALLRAIDEASTLGAGG
ncbi:MAG: anthranilate synthase component I [Chloroflexota bacterium]|nr:MAG: anthranilate synthase component I [Chloroflexota bacterium]